MSAHTIKISSDTVFAWSAGLCIRAPTRVYVSVPGSLVNENQAFGEVIQLSDDDADIAFHEQPGQQIGFSRISIELKAGQTLRINKSTEAVIETDENSDVVFEVVSIESKHRPKVVGKTQKICRRP